VKNGTGKLIDVQGGFPHGTDYSVSFVAWPTLNSTTAPTDSDHDGMPDSWEISQGLNPNNAADRNNRNSDGYTMLEIYLNYLVTGEEPVSATWALTSDQAATSSSSVTATSQSFASGMVASYASYTPGSGLYSGQTVNAQRIKPSAGWPASQTAPVETQYAEYKVAPATGKSLSISSMSFDFGDAGSTSTMKANIYYSLDGFATRTLLNATPLTLPKYSATELFTQVSYNNLTINVASGSTLTLRVYPWWPSGASTTKYLVERNIKITGNAKPASQGQSAIRGSDKLLDLKPESESEKMLIFPNPVKDKLMVSFPESKSEAKITVLNSAGTRFLIQTVQPNSKQVSIDVSGLAAGNYFLVFQQGSTKQTEQFVKY